MPHLDYTTRKDIDHCMGIRDVAELYDQPGCQVFWWKEILVVVIRSLFKPASIGFRQIQTTVPSTNSDLNLAI